MTDLRLEGCAPPGDGWDISPPRSVERAEAIERATSSRVFFVRAVAHVLLASLVWGSLVALATVSRRLASASKEPAAEAASDRPASTLRERTVAYFQLTKPRIIVLLLITNKKGSNPFASALVFAVLAFLIYVPAGYYLELFLWNRRMKKRGAPPPKRSP